LKVAILFEESGTVRDAFLKRGHQAVSCDMLPTSSPGPHLQGDVFSFSWAEFDLIIAHPPCTYIAVSGNAHYANTALRQEAANLIWRVWNLNTDKPMCLENPVGQINTYLPEMPRPYYIQPWQFGHPESKKTGLWTRKLPKLIPTDVLEMREYWENQTPSGQNKLGPSKHRAKIRSKTYKNIAEAMAEQWSNL